MSTYTVAFVVSDLKNVSMHDNTVWLWDDVLPQGKYALSIAQVIIMLLENYAEIMYELPKLDQMSVPNLHFFRYGELGYCYREISNDTYIYHDFTYWNYNTLFRVKVSLLILKRNPDLMLTHTKRLNKLCGLYDLLTLSKDTSKPEVSRSLM